MTRSPAEPGRSPEPGQGSSQSSTSVLEPYFIGLNKRAMVSLGPLKQNPEGLEDKDKKYCTYSCKFCYVLGPFPRYAKRSAAQVTEWLTANYGDDEPRFDIVYISGDTDSFAPPRTGQALDLVEGILDNLPKVDVLFTTRHVFSDEDRARLEAMNKRFERNGRSLIPCISISQLNYAGLEPHPIPSPQERLAQVRSMSDAGMKVVLTVRPFVPYIPAEEYVEIIRQGGRSHAVILGGDWYTDSEGALDAITREALRPHLGDLEPMVAEGEPEPLDFANDDTKWFTHHHPTAEAAAKEECRRLDLRFYMRSAEAVEFIRGR